MTLLAVVAFIATAMVGFSTFQKTQGVHIATPAITATPVAAAENVAQDAGADKPGAGYPSSTDGEKKKSIHEPIGDDADHCHGFSVQSTLKEINGKYIHNPKLGEKR